MTSSLKAAVIAAALSVSPPYPASGDVFVDKGACPGEGCSHGERWGAKVKLHLLTEPSASAATTVPILPGKAVRTITGEVHTIPSRFVVQHEHGPFRPGDEILVYTYLGEGFFRVRHNGELTEADLGFSPWGGTACRRCERDPQCWGVLDEPLEFEWWVLVRTSEGSEGWVLDSKAFELPDTH